MKRNADEDGIKNANNKCKNPIITNLKTKQTKNNLFYSSDHIVINNAITIS